MIKELQEARLKVEGIVKPMDLALPGMAVDRTPEEQQAINYAFANGATWAILTSFEKLRLFNARRDWLVLSFEKPEAYLDDFGLLWQLAYQNILKGSLDDLSRQRWSVEVDTTYLAFINEWRERLAQDILHRRAQNPWAFHADGRIHLPLLRSVVQRFLDRLVVVRFAEDHLVIKPGTLRGIYELTQENPYVFTLDQFMDEFFRRFDQAHNSALFALGVVDEASFSDEVLLPLIAKLYEARYRAMPADILGNTYEQYLGKALVLDNGSITTRDNLETRKKQGSYYTPQVIVQYIVDNSLGRYLYGTHNGKPDGQPLDGEWRKRASDIQDLRVLDSACGSGSFLIYAYYVLADFYEGEIHRLEAEAEQRRLELIDQGITSPLDIRIELTPYMAEIERLRSYPRTILETHLYGVDLDPQAAEIAVVNLMMRAMERRQHEKRLPLILNQNVKVGNSLIGLRYDDPIVLDQPEKIAQICQLRQALIASPNGPDHDQIIDNLVAAIAELNAELVDLYTPHFSDLERVRPFHWGIEFPEVFYNTDGTLQDKPGFTIIFGNPPWEILKPDLREFYAQFDDLIESKLNRAQAEQRIAELEAEDPRRPVEYAAQKQVIEETAAYIRQCPDYAHQGRGDTATHKLFMERAYSLLQREGRLGYVVPAGVYSDLGTRELRELFLTEGNIQYVYGLSNERFFFPGVHHAFKFALVGVQKGVPSPGFWAAFRINPRVAIHPDNLPDFLANEANLIYIKNTSLNKFSPETLALMELQTQRDYEVAETLYDEWGLLEQNLKGLWELQFAYEFHMANDAHLFNQSQQGIPLYEGKMIHQFDAYFANAQYWIEEDKGLARLENSAKADWHRGYRFAFREVSGMVNERTCMACVLPPHTFAGHTLWVGVAPDPQILLYYVAVINSLAIDWLVRSKGGTHVTLFLMKSLPVACLEPGDPYFDAIIPRAARLTCTRSEFADLWQEVMGESWNPSKGAVDPDERQQLRHEIDAIVAHLYGLTREEFDHILGTFPLVFPDTTEGNAKRARLLTIYDG